MIAGAWKFINPNPAVEPFLLGRLLRCLPCGCSCYVQVKEVPPAAAAWANEFSTQQQGQQGPAVWGDEFASFQAQQHPAATGEKWARDFAGAQQELATYHELRYLQVVCSTLGEAAADICCRCRG